MIFFLFLFFRDFSFLAHHQYANYQFGVDMLIVYSKIRYAVHMSVWRKSHEVDGNVIELWEQDDFGFGETARVKIYINQNFLNVFDNF